MNIHHHVMSVFSYSLVFICLKWFVAVESIFQAKIFHDQDMNSVLRHGRFQMVLSSAGSSYNPTKIGLRYNLGQPDSAVRLGKRLVTDINPESSPLPHEDMLVGKYLQVIEAENLQPGTSPSGPSPSSDSHLCDSHGLCGVYGVCNVSNSPLCECMQGFKPKSQQEWSSMNWSQGCVRDRTLKCSVQDQFIPLVGIKLPDGIQRMIDQSIGLQECGQNCLRNCSCTAYSMVTNNDTGTESLFPIGCAMWFVDLINIRHNSSGGQNLYVRIAASESGTTNNRGSKKKVTIVVCLTLTAIAVALVLIVCYLFKFKGRKIKGGIQMGNIKEQQTQMEDLDLPQFDLATIITATDNFSMNNKLGEGGYGPVYLGKLVDGQEIAVKRLSLSSGQGLTEFKNEVKLIAKVQHRNLVRLLGCCIQGEEKMLIYEYMPNKSLDSFLFDETRRKLLDWPKRFQIVNGIARGLLYLHEESRLTIIHRDLKASNVLLDYQFNPKISDFGMARSFGGDETEANTRRIVGTFGYMAPEYAIDGLFSVKSDVFSFGILLLEIVSGQRNRGFYNPNHFQNLISHAWKLRKEGRAFEMVDPILLEDSYNLTDILRCIHISLLCLQRHPEERPSMSSVVLMFGSDIEISEPKQPGFLVGRKSSEASTSSSKQKSSSTNEITMSIIEAR